MFNANGSYGVVVYDVSTSHQEDYAKIRKLIGKWSIRINLSVYLYPWSYHEIIQKSLVEGGLKGTSIYALKFDNVSKEQAIEMARSSLTREIVEVREYINNKESLEQKHFDYATKKLDNIKRLAVLFNLTEDVQDLINLAEEFLLTKAGLIEYFKRK